MRFATAMLLLEFFLSSTLTAQVKPFRLAFISDTHIGSPDGKAEEDLERTISDINQQKNIELVVITGDITELGTDAQLLKAKTILNKLNLKYYIIPGNHDDGWSESGGATFIKTFGDDRFTFDHNGIRFMGCASGPYVRMSDGHIPRESITWISGVLDSTSPKMPLIFLNHYPIDNQLDNWYEVIDLLKRKQTVLIMCGHGHANKALDFENIPGVMGRSNLRGKHVAGGYNLVDISSDSILFSERNPLTGETKLWTKVPIRDHMIDTIRKFSRPNFFVSSDSSKVKIKWVFSSDANIISTPGISKKLVIFGNQNGLLTAIRLKDASEVWHFKSGESIFSSPAISNKRIVFGSSDHYIYCLTLKGKLKWKFETGAAVLASPMIKNNIVYIGGSDHAIRAISLQDGKLVWIFRGLDGPVVGTPLMFEHQIIIGAWDTYLYCLNARDGILKWKWSNGSSVRNFSPAACIPVIHSGIVYIVAPDRYLTAIDLQNGRTLWRTNESAVRESIGISEDGKTIYGKCMNDSVVAFSANSSFQKASWKINVGYGYEHVPSMLIEKDKRLFFGTRNGVVYSINLNHHTTDWSYKIDNSMVNTVRVFGHSLIASTMDGKVVLLKY